MYNLKKFEGINQRVENRITITSSNAFGFPTKFYQDNHIDQFKYVVLYYDLEQKAIGFQFTNTEEERNKFTILRSKGGYGGSIVATSFFKNLGINSKEYKGRYVWEKQSIEGIGDVFIIKLTQGE